MYRVRRGARFTQNALRSESVAGAPVRSLRNVVGILRPGGKGGLLSGDILLQCPRITGLRGLCSGKLCLLIIVTL